MRQALPADRRVAGQGRPAAVAKRVPGLLEALGRGDHAIAVVVAAFFVTRAIDREQHLGAELAALLEHLVDQFAIGLRMRGQLLERVFDLQQLVDDELHVAQRGLVLGHLDNP